MTDEIEAMLSVKNLLNFVETPLFTNKWQKEGLSDETLIALQNTIARSPDRHPMIQGTGGVRKVRFSDSKSNRGMRGSFRGCYAFFSSHGRVYLLTFYGKNEKDNLTKAERNTMAQIVANIERSLA